MADFSAETVLQQLGGKRFIAMTGAKNFVKDENSMAFQVPKAKDGIDGVKITLNSMDTYNIEFISLRAGKRKVVRKFDNVYNDQLQDIFTKNTGLYTHL